MYRPKVKMYQKYSFPYNILDQKSKRTKSTVFPIIYLTKSPNVPKVQTYQKYSLPYNILDQKSKRTKSTVFG